MHDLQKHYKKPRIIVVIKNAQNGALRTKKEYFNKWSFDF
jgi:hypothetical protein